MKKTYLALFILVSLNFGCKKKEWEKSGSTKIIEIYSEYTSENYEITLYYPESILPDHPVPAVYLLDGFWYKDMGMKLAWELYQQGKTPPFLLVSLDYKNGNGLAERFKDLVYPWPGIDAQARGNLFFQFLSKELVPAVESKFETDTTKRTILGHSLGGLFAMYSLLDHADNPLFKKIVAASISIGMGENNYLFTKEEEVSQFASDMDVDLFIGCGTLVGSAPAMHAEFFKRLKSRNYPGLNAEIQFFPNTHGTDVYPSFKNGLDFVFHE